MASVIGRFPLLTGPFKRDSTVYEIMIAFIKIQSTEQESEKRNRKQSVDLNATLNLKGSVKDLETSSTSLEKSLILGASDGNLWCRIYFYMIVPT